MLAALTSLLSTYGYGLVFGLILLESAGLPLPGETMLVIASASAASGHLSVFGVILSAALGAILGDMGGYWIGRKGGSVIFKRILGIAYEEHLVKGQAFFMRYGAASVFLRALYLLYASLPPTWLAFPPCTFKLLAFTMQRADWPGLP